MTNSARHDIVPPGSDVGVEIDAVGGLLREEVYDSGGETPDLRPADRSDGGFGLQLVDQLADRWGSEHDDEDTCVWFGLTLTPMSVL